MIDGVIADMVDRLDYVCVCVIYQKITRISSVARNTCVCVCCIVEYIN